MGETLRLVRLMLTRKLQSEASIQNPFPGINTFSTKMRSYIIINIFNIFFLYKSLNFFEVFVKYFSFNICSLIMTWISKEFTMMCHWMCNVLKRTYWNSNRLYIDRLHHQWTYILFVKDSSYAFPSLAYWHYLLQ